MPDGIDFDNVEKYTYENRDQQRYSLPHRIIFRIYYDQAESIKQHKHLYHLIPMMEINNGEVSTQPIRPYHRQYYRKAIEDFNKQFKGIDFGKLYTIEELSSIGVFYDRLRERDNGIRPGFPEDITFEEEQMIYNFSINIPRTDVMRFFNVEEIKPEVVKTKAEEEVETLRSQVSELTSLVKQLLDKKD